MHCMTEWKKLRWPNVIKRFCLRLKQRYHVGAVAQNLCLCWWRWCSVSWQILMSFKYSNYPCEHIHSHMSLYPIFHNAHICIYIYISIHIPTCILISVCICIFVFNDVNTQILHMSPQSPIFRNDVNMGMRSTHRVAHNCGSQCRAQEWNFVLQCPCAIDIVYIIHIVYK